jgi:phosphopantetheinyl transferase (holo-ACP synthase)
VIGNDIVDLAKAKEDSDIYRPRFFEKICSQEEIDLILSNHDSWLTFWRVWTMKETAYKAFQRKLNFKTIFNPFAFTCKFVDSEYGSVYFNGDHASVQTLQTDNYMYSEVTNIREHRRFFGTTLCFLEYIKKEQGLKYLPEILKDKYGLPGLKLGDYILPISKTHHGSFQVFQYKLIDK